MDMRTDHDQLLIEAIQKGLPLVHRPYAEIAEQIGLTETEVIARLRQLIDRGDIKRFGVVVRHRELGFRANGMVVWDIPDEQVSELGRCIGQFPFVTLSYRRPRRLPDWPYNLFTMVHGRDRSEVLKKVAYISQQCGLSGISHDILFSQRCFKQCGAQYSRNSILPSPLKAAERAG